MSGVTASIAPAAREVFLQLDRKAFNTPADFGEAFNRVVSELGPMPRFFSPEEAIDWASRRGYISVDPRGVIRVDLNKDGH